MVRRLALVLVVGSSMLVLPTGVGLSSEGDAATIRLESRPYHGAEGLDLVCLFDEGIPVVTQSTRTCFSVQDNEISVALTLVDGSGLVAPATYQFYDAAGDWLGEAVGFCGETTAVIPAGAVFLDVAAGYTFDPLLCGATFATSGTATAAFTAG